MFTISSSHNAVYNFTQCLILYSSVNTDLQSEDQYNQ